MDAKLKADWVKALRSGEFPQGQSYLEFEGKFCCLGVLVEVQGHKVVEAFPEIDDRMTARLPERYAGGLLTYEMTDLANRNDGAIKYKRHTFPEMADHIEAHL